jgi:RNA-directed DNA polymerase
LEKAIIIENARGSYRMDPNNKVHLVRYADDFVIIAPTKTALELRIAKAREFLEERGLEISPTKSKITTIYEGSIGAP